ESQNFSVKALLAGLIVALTTDIHLNGVIYIPVLGLLFLYDYKWAFLRSKRFWSFALGVSIGVFYFVAMHILPYPQTFFSLFSIGNGTGRTPPLSSLDPNVWLAALRYPIDLLDLRAVIVGMAIVYLLWKGSAGDRKLVFLMTM